MACTRRHATSTPFPPTTSLDPQKRLLNGSRVHHLRCGAGNRRVRFSDDAVTTMHSPVIPPVPSHVAAADTGVTPGSGPAATASAAPPGTNAGGYAGGGVGGYAGDGAAVAGAPVPASGPGGL